MPSEVRHAPHFPRPRLFEEAFPPPAEVPPEQNERTCLLELNGYVHWLGKYGTEESRQAYDRLVAEWLANGRRTIQSHLAAADALVKAGKYDDVHDDSEAIRALCEKIGGPADPIRSPPMIER